MATADTLERSVQDSRPVELYQFTADFRSWWLTTYHKDITYSGQLYTATPGARSDLEIYETASDQFDVTIELPAKHELVQLYANGVPPDIMTCEIFRLQPDASPLLAASLWKGSVTALSFKGRMGSFKIPAATVEAMQHELPNVLAQPLCNHVLYDSFCTVSRGSFSQVTQIVSVSVDGRTITTADPVPAAVRNITPNNTNTVVDWALHGELIHLLTGNRRTIIAQPGGSLTQFTIQCEFPSLSLHAGDFVGIYAGCSKQRGQCRAKFGNVINFGGHPDMPKSNIFYVKNIFSANQRTFTLGDD